MTKFKNEIQIWSQGLMVEDVTEKETLIFKRSALGKFQEIVIAGKELTKML